MKEMVLKGWEVLAVAPESTYGEKLKNEGIPFFSLTMDRKGKNPFSDLSLVLRLFRLYRRERPEIIHHFTIKPVIYGSFAAKFVPSVFAVNAVTGLGYVFKQKGWIRKLVEGFYRLVLKGKGYTIFQNPENLSYFVENNLISEDRAFVIKGSGVDVRKFAPVVSKGDISTGRTVFLMVSRMLWDKGVREFVEASEIVKERFAEAVFWLVGNVDQGNPSSIPEEWLRKETEKGTVKRWGHQENVISFIRDADVMVLPSHHEGLPKTLLEGAAMEKPIITTDIAGCREIVEDGVNGLLIPVKNARKLAEAMVYMISNPLSRVKMGKKGREKVVQHFSDEIVVEKTLEIYRKARSELFS